MPPDVMVCLALVWPGRRVGKDDVVGLRGHGGVPFCFASMFAMFFH